MVISKAEKCVFVIDSSLSRGVQANTAAVLTTALCNKVAGITGEDVEDCSGTMHPAITSVPFPMLRAKKGELLSLYSNAVSRGIFVAGFSEAAQTARDYEQYTRRMAGLEMDEHKFLGLVLCGDRKVVESMTGSFALL